MRADYVILGSILSEKSVLLSEKKVYTLKVSVCSTKDDIRKALKDVFAVDVVQVNTSIIRGKSIRRAKTKKSAPKDVKKSNFKKAYVVLRDGQSLPMPDATPSATVG